MNPTCGVAAGIGFVAPEPCRGRAGVRPRGGQIGRFELTLSAGPLENGSHDETLIPQCCIQRQVAEEFVAGETLRALSKQYDISRQPIRIWIGKFEAGALDDDGQAADLLQEYEAKIAALKRMVGRQALVH